MDAKFGKYTLDELKKACEICLDNSKGCTAGCPMNGNGIGICRMDKNTSVLELIDVYKDTRKMHQYWFTKAQELEAKDEENKQKINALNLEKIVLEDKADKATKYDSVRNELIRTQELLKNAQDECRKRAESMKDMRETIDAMDDDYNELSTKLDNAEMVRKSLERDNKSLKAQLKELQDTLDLKQTVIAGLTKGAEKAQDELLHYHVLLGSLKAIGKAIFNDQSGNHEKD